MRFHLIENPVAGRGDGHALVGQVGAGLRAAGHDVWMHAATSAADMAAHVGGLDVGAVDRLVVAGGDGTLKVVVNALPTQGAPPVGVLPRGTANLVARDCGMPLGGEPARIVAALEQAVPWRVDALRVRHADGREETALATVGAGLDADVVHRVARLRRESGGSGGYRRWFRPVADAIRSFSFPVLDATVDDRRLRRGTLVIVQNTLAWGGLFRLSPDARLDSGRLVVTLVKARALRDLVRVGLEALARRVERDRQVRFLPGEHVRIHGARPVPLQADGDPAGWTDVEVRVVPGALTLLRAAPG
jgi:diacylglycerol kinase (ATP)